MHRELDKENMFGAIWNFPENLKEAHHIGSQISLKQEYSEILECDLGGDDIQEIITNLVDLVIEFSDYNVYKLINLEDYTVSQLMDYEYLKIQMETLINNYLTN